MKKSVITLIVLAWSSLLFSQEYVPLIEENKSWNVLDVIFISSFDSTFSTSCYTLAGDTTVATVSYKKLYRSSVTNPDDWELAYLMREDVSKKVWLKPLNENEEYLMYDFSLEAGESITVGVGEPATLQIDSVAQVTIDLSARNKFWLSCNEMPEYQETWIEGIGSSKGICHSGSAFIVGGWHRFLCLSDESGLVYSNPHYQSCWLATNIEDPVDDANSIYPNPAKDFIILNNIITTETITLKNTNGQVIRQYPAKEKRLDVSGIPSGLYFLQIHSGKEINIHKVIVNQP